MNIPEAWIFSSLLTFSLIYLLLGIDDLVIDFFRWSKRLRPKELQPIEKKRLLGLQEKKIAIIVPTWKESEIIADMLKGNIARIEYQNFHFFVGCYANDLPTYRAVSTVSKETGKVTPVLNMVPGPTSKGQILNRVLQYLIQGESERFDAYLFHDAEDIIHPLSLKLINSELEKADFVQIPVFSLPVDRLLGVGAVYMDEFAVVQTQDLLVRKALNAGLPSSGVGFCLTRRALKQLEAAMKGEIFQSGCLTEDYLLGLRTYQSELKQSFPCLFERNQKKEKDWIATFEYFPRKFFPSIKQKARWTQGITLQASKELGWFGSLANSYFLFRDRKGLLTHCLGFLGLILIPLSVLTSVSPAQLDDLAPIFVINGCLFLNRLLARIRAYHVVYETIEPLKILLRYFLGIAVNGLAGFLALKNHFRSVITQKPAVWVKTNHELPLGFGKTGSLSLLLFLAATSTVAQENPCLQIFFDEPKEQVSFQYFGRTHAMFIQNLMGHFPNWTQKVVPIDQYQKKQLDQCEANIFLGTNFQQEIPTEFILDFEQTKKRVLWAGYHIWKLSPEALAKIFGVSFNSLTQINPSFTDQHGRPHFFKWYHYKGEIFEKYGEFDKQDPSKFNAAFEITQLKLLAERNSQINVLAWAEHSGTGEKIPYIISGENHWYIADSPFSFITEKDRYLIFTDLLFDLLQESPRHEGKRPAFVRFEDIHPNIPLWQLDAYFRIFKKAQIPFAISLIPIFVDPLMVQVDDRSERTVSISQRKLFISFLQEAEKIKGSVILHGITHQYRNIKNPFNGVSGDDFEFWDGVHHKPIPEDSVSYVLNRIEFGWELVRSVGFNPVAWLTPHYQASPLDFILFGQIFHWNIGRVVYFPHKKKNFREIPSHLTLNSSGAEGNQERFKFLNNLVVQFPTGLKPSGQFFPYEIWGDVFGQRLIPENLGNIQPFLNEQVHQTQKIEDMIACAKRNRVLRDHWASLFIHPVLIQTSNDEGLAEYPGEGEKLVTLFRTIEDLGYEFIDLKDWVQVQPLFRRSEPQELLNAYY